MDEKLREITNLGVEIMNSKRQVKRKLGHVVQIVNAVNVMLNLSTVFALQTAKTSRGSDDLIKWWFRVQ